MTVRVDRPAAGVGRVLIDRPAARNAVDATTRVALISAISEAMADDGVRALVIGGVGGVFCAGGDLPSMVGLDRDAALARLRHGHELTALLWNCPKPVVAAVERFAMGAGAGLALTADDIVLGRTAAIGFPFLKLGLVPDWGLMLGLPRRTGWAVAARLFRDCATVKGEEALALGLADRLADDDHVMAEALRVAGALALLPPVAFGRLKHRMRGDAATVLALPAEAEAQADCLISAEFAEGYAAFREKRAPRF